MERVHAFVTRLIREIEDAETSSRAHGEERPDLIVQLAPLREILRLLEAPEKEGKVFWRPSRFEQGIMESKEYQELLSGKGPYLRGLDEQERAQSLSRNAHLYLDIVAPNPSRRAHWALVRAGSFAGPVLLSIRLDNDSTVTEERTPDDTWRARVTLAQELVDARNEKLLVKSQEAGAELTPEAARKHAERILEMLMKRRAMATDWPFDRAAVGLVAAELLDLASAAPRRGQEVCAERSEPDPTPTTAEEEIGAQEGSEGPNEAFAQSVANQRQARALEQAEARAWEATCAALEGLCVAERMRGEGEAHLRAMVPRTAIAIGRATAQAFAEGSETRRPTAEEGEERERKRCLRLIQHMIDGLVPEDQWIPEKRSWVKDRLEQLIYMIRKGYQP